MKENFSAFSLFNDAVLSNDIALLNELILSGKDFSAVNIYGDNILHTASCLNRNNIVENLIDRLGISIKFLNVPNDYGYLPLHLAAYHGSLDVFNTLFKLKNDDLFAETDAGRTAAYFATIQGHLDNIKLISRYDISAIEYKDKTGANLLYFAVQNRHFNIIEYFLSKSNNIENLFNKDNSGNTVFHLIAKNDDLEVFKFILSHNNIFDRFFKEKSIFIKNNNNQSVLKIASENSYYQVMNYINEEILFFGGALLEYSIKHRDIEALRYVDHSRMNYKHFLRYAELEFLKYFIEGRFISKSCFNENIVFVFSNIIFNDNFKLLKYLLEEEREFGEIVIENIRSLVVDNSHNSYNVIKYLFDKEPRTKGELINKHHNKLLLLFISNNDYKMAENLIHESEIDKLDIERNFSDFLFRSSMSGCFDFIRLIIDEYDLDAESLDYDSNNLYNSLVRKNGYTPQDNNSGFIVLYLYEKNFFSHEEYIKNAAYFWQNKIENITDKILKFILTEKSKLIDIHSGIYNLMTDNSFAGKEKFFQILKLYTFLNQKHSYKFCFNNALERLLDYEDSFIKKEIVDYFISNNFLFLSGVNKAGLISEKIPININQVINSFVVDDLADDIFLYKSICIDVSAGIENIISLLNQEFYNDQF